MSLNSVNTFIQRNSISGGLGDIEVDNLQVDGYIRFSDGTTQTTAATGGGSGNITCTNLTVTGNTQVGNAATDTLTIYATPTFVNGSNAMQSSFTLAPNISPGTNVVTLVSISNVYKQITVMFYGLSTTTTTLRPHIRIKGSTDTSSGAHGCTATNGGGSSNAIQWANNEAYIWGETWDPSYLLYGKITFTRMNTISTLYTYWSVDLQTSIDGSGKCSYGSGSLLQIGIGSSTIEIHAGTGATFDNGQYNVTYI